MSQVSAPVSTSVIALDVPGVDAADKAVSSEFDRIVATARALGFVTRDAGEFNLTLTLAPETQIDATLLQLAAEVARFDISFAPLHVRAMVHHGVVFRADSAGQVGYVGSAIRSTQSALRRAPASGGFMATFDFASHVSALQDLSFSLEPMTGPAAAERTSQIVFADGSVNEVAPRKGRDAIPIDQAFIEFTKKRLAEDLGPFAGALVDRAAKSSSMVEQLLPALCREIEGSIARARFEKDMLLYVDSRSGG